MTAVFTENFTPLVQKVLPSGTSLVVQWLRLHAPNAGGLVPSLVRELDPICMPQLRPGGAK